MTEKETTALALLREFWEHHESPFECGNVYISRKYADRDVEIHRRIREFFAEVDNDKAGGGHDPYHDCMPKGSSWTMTINDE